MASEPSAPNREAWAAHRPGLTVPVEGMGGAGRGVKQLGAVRQVHKHGGSRSYGRLPSAPTDGSNRS